MVDNSSNFEINFTPNDSRGTVLLVPGSTRGALEEPLFVSLTHGLLSMNLTVVGKSHLFQQRGEIFDPNADLVPEVVALKSTLMGLTAQQEARVHVIGKSFGAQLALEALMGLPDANLVKILSLTTLGFQTSQVIEPMIRFLAQRNERDRRIVVFQGERDDRWGNAASVKRALGVQAGKVVVNSLLGGHSFEGYEPELVQSVLSLEQFVNA